MATFGPGANTASSAVSAAVLTDVIAPPVSDAPAESAITAPGGSSSSSRALVSGEVIAPPTITAVSVATS